MRGILVVVVGVLDGRVRFLRVRPEGLVDRPDFLDLLVGHPHLLFQDGNGDHAEGQPFPIPGLSIGRGFRSGRASGGNDQ